jgi:catechol 2,3-dioxygenase-like lactoylglutathione lyase family enzyme
MSLESAGATTAGAVLGIDHVALPMQNTSAMIAFYRSFGLTVDESPYLVRVHLGDQMINFHRPEVWQRDLSLRAPAALPPCGDLCLVWQGSPESLLALLQETDAQVVEGPVEREGGRRTMGSSMYVRDPDGNLIEFITYPEESTVGRSGR